MWIEIKFTHLFTDIIEPNTQPIDVEYGLYDMSTSDATHMKLATI